MGLRVTTFLKGKYRGQPCCQGSQELESIIVTRCYSFKLCGAEKSFTDPGDYHARMFV